MLQITAARDSHSVASNTACQLTIKISPPLSRPYCTRLFQLVSDSISAALKGEHLRPKYYMGRQQIFKAAYF